MVASPYRGNVEENEWYARTACTDAVSRGELPIAPHLLFTQFLDDGDELERDIGMNMGQHLLRHHCQLLAVYDDNGISDGMKAEIALAERFGITVEYRSVANGMH